MISFTELIKAGDTPDADQRAHLYRLHYCLNFIRALYAKPLLITSGLRTREDQIRIYSAKGQTPKMGSLHLIGGAADVSDPDGELKKWILDHLEVAEELKLYFEDFDSTPNWIHLQIYPPSSGSRFFKP